MTWVAIVGATGTIGSELAKQLARSDQSVLLLGRNEAKLAALGEELSQPWKVIDASKSASLEGALMEHATVAGPVSSIVNAIGSVLLKSAHATSDDEFRETLETNLFTAFACVRAAGRCMREKGGSVVLFASAAATIGIANHEAIAAAKGGVIGLTRSAAATYAPFNIRINVVSPGLVKTELTKRIWSNPMSAAASTELHALGRLGEPSQVARLVGFLIDPTNDWITGQTIGIDGGLGCLVPTRKPSGRV